MRKLIITTVAALAAFPALAADVQMDTKLGMTMSDATAALVDMGYDVRKSEMENGMMEFYVVKGNKTAEVYVNAATGMVAKISN